LIADATAELEGFFQIVADEDDRALRFALQIKQLVLQGGVRISGSSAEKRLSIQRIGAFGGAKARARPTRCCIAARQLG